MRRILTLPIVVGRRPGSYDPPRCDGRADFSTAGCGLSSAIREGAGRTVDRTILRAGLAGGPPRRSHRGPNSTFPNSSPYHPLAAFRTRKPAVPHAIVETERFHPYPASQTPILICSRVRRPAAKAVAIVPPSPDATIGRLLKTSLLLSFFWALIVQTRSRPAGPS